MKHDSVAPDATPRRWSLEREWFRAFNIMLVLLLVASVVTFSGVRQLVGHFGSSTRQLVQQSTAVAALRNQLNVHEDKGHQMIDGAPVDRAAFLREQHDISRSFESVHSILPPGEEGRLELTERAWRAALTTAGLWEEPLTTFPNIDNKRQAQLGSDSDSARALLDGLQKPALDAMRDRLAADERLERRLLILLTGVFALALGATMYFRRRMRTDLVRPVATMHEGVLKIQAGEYGHRLHIARHDELGDLAQAFNDMAGALDQSHAALTLRATHDPLTGLANRAALTERLNASFVAEADRRALRESVLFIDIDDFKEVNDSLGHEAGDALLVLLAQRLVACVRPPDLVARLGGDEFAIVVVENEAGTIAVEVAERISAALREPFAVKRNRLVVSVSIGIAGRESTTADPSELLRHADFAMYMAKGGGKSRYEMFDARMHEELVGLSTLTVDVATT